MCQIEDFYLQLTKLQRCVDVSAVVRTFSTMLNLNPSTGCQPLVCNNKTAESHVRVLMFHNVCETGNAHRF